VINSPPSKQAQGNLRYMPFMDECSMHRQQMELLPLDDGITHINIYSRGHTELGRLLTNPSPIGFEHPAFGHFNTAEGLHFFLKTGMLDYEYAQLSGFEARKKGKADHKNYIQNPDFDRLMRIGWICKITQNPKLYELVITNTLPLVHYYYYGKPDNCKVIPDRSNFTGNLTAVCKFLTDH